MHSGLRHVARSAGLLLLLLAPTSSYSNDAFRRIEAKGLDESSGLVRSEVHDGVFWSHNDSGGAPELFALDSNGNHLGQVSVSGATARDWEDITTDNLGNLWIHDGGNNKNKRRDLTVIRVPEPTSLSGAVKADRLVRYHFPEQTAFPPPDKNFDSEALFWDRGRLMLLTKHRADTRTVLYAFPEGFDQAVDAPLGDPSGLVSIPLKKVSEFDVGGDKENFGGKVTAADISSDGKLLAVLTYHAVFVFERPAAGLNWLSGSPLQIHLVQLLTQQCEAIAWDNGGLVLTNEGRAVMRIEAPLSQECKTFPSPGCASRR